MTMPMWLFVAHTVATAFLGCAVAMFMVRRTVREVVSEFPRPGFNPDCPSCGGSGIDGDATAPCRACCTY